MAQDGRSWPSLMGTRVWPRAARPAAAPPGGPGAARPRSPAPARARPRRRTRAAWLRRADSLRGSRKRWSAASRSQRGAGPRSIGTRPLPGNGLSGPSGWSARQRRGARTRDQQPLDPLLDRVGVAREPVQLLRPARRHHRARGQADGQASPARRGTAAPACRRAGCAARASAASLPAPVETRRISSSGAASTTPRAKSRPRGSSIAELAALGHQRELARRSGSRRAG